MEMSIKMGDYIKTLVDKDASWGSEMIHVPSGSIGLVCEIFEGGALMMETPDSLPFALVLYKENECIKIDEETAKRQKLNFKNN